MYSLWYFTRWTFFLRVNDIIIRVSRNVLRNILSVHSPWITKACQQEKQDANHNSPKAHIPTKKQKLNESIGVIIQSFKKITKRNQMTYL